MQYLRHIYVVKKLFVYLKFKWNGVPDILSGNPTLDSNVLCEFKSVTRFL